MWHPSGVSAPPEVLALIALLLPVVALVALWAVSRGIGRGTAAGSLNGLLWLALGFVVLTGGLRIFLMYQFGWDLQNGTYIDVSTVWYGVVLAEFIVVGLWTLSIVMGHVRGTAPITQVQARTLMEQWSYVTVIAFAVYCTSRVRHLAWPCFGPQCSTGVSNQCQSSALARRRTCTGGVGGQPQPRWVGALDGTLEIGLRLWAGCAAASRWCRRSRYYDTTLSGTTWCSTCCSCSSHPRLSF